MIKNGFVIEPYPELLPDYKICPFSEKDIFTNRALPKSDFADDYFNTRFTNKKILYTLNGREAIYIALKHYKLKKNDCVTIFTTTGNFYISNCVTKEIEKVCKWSRQIETNTKVILVNHEFGQPFEELHSLYKYNLPIIEDCAHSFFSTDIENRIGEVGDFVIFSFPKAFPIQFGGLLVSKKEIQFTSELDILSKNYLNNTISHYIPQIKEIKTKRVQNHQLAEEYFVEIGCGVRFNVNEKKIPGVFMLINDEIDLPKLKEYYYKHGVQCSVFYGENTFFLPIHQNINQTDIEYFIEILKSFNVV
ncbi:MAG: DegT/DnrJ/EryC1/StrS aminotransferase family protein [Bacteroidales bacterium]|nr:DegT/DnrJ/EryC1/StrS aminotransferase family protein [Bacteroidales bacterium]